MNVLTVKELSALLRVSRSKIYAMSSAGELPVFEVGGSLRFVESEIVAWIASQRRGVPEKKPRKERVLLKNFKHA